MQLRAPRLLPIENPHRRRLHCNCRNQENIYLNNFFLSFWLIVSFRKPKENRIDAASEYAKERAGAKALLNLVVVGHVDAGKSTLMGHLLYRLGQVSAKQMHKYEQESTKLGKQSFKFAWVLDETGEERYFFLFLNS